MEYKIISDSDSSEVSRRVTEYLADGWELYGEPKVTAYYADYHESEGGAGEHVAIFAQAIILPDSTK
jgi:hypothetical protein